MINVEIHPILYNTLIDPLLQSSRKKIISRIKPGNRVIDIASGTGQLTREMAGITPYVTGVDIEKSMINFASKRMNGSANGKLSYKIADARSLSEFKKENYDLATMSLALHQFAPGEWDAILNEIFNITEKLLILDYNYPLPPGLKKNLVYFIERVAGREHSRNFRAYMRAGGVIPIIEKQNLVCKEQEVSGSGIFSLYDISIS